MTSEFVVSFPTRKMNCSEQSEVKWNEVAQSCLTLCNPVDCSLPGSSVHGILQARIVEWIAISFSRGSSRPRDRTRVSTLEADALTSEPPGKPLTYNPVFSSVQFSSVTQSCPTLCNLMDCSLPGSSVHGIFQARVLEWGAIAFSKRMTTSLRSRK